LSTTIVPNFLPVGKDFTNGGGNFLPVGNWLLAPAKTAAGSVDLSPVNFACCGQRGGKFFAVDVMGRGDLH
jgi:hypothetical protein